MAQQAPRPARRIHRVAASALSAIVIIFAWPVHAPAQSQGRKASDAAIEQANKIRATTGATTSSTPIPAGDPCRLLSNDDVHKLFPKTAGVNGKWDHSREEYGIVACIWDYPAGSVIVRVTLDARQGGSGDDVQMFADANPMKPAHGIRYEKITGVGDEAVAVVENRNPGQGIQRDLSVMLTQRGKQQVVIVSSELPASERAASLKVLEGLGRTAISRL